MLRFFGFIFMINSLISSGQTIQIDSLRRLHQHQDYHLLNDSTKADICRNLAINHVRISATISRSYAEEFLGYANRMHSEKDIAIALNLIGVSYISAGDLEKGLEYYLQSLSYRKRIGDSVMISNSMNNIGTVYVRLNQFDRGIDFYNQALSIRIAKSDEEGISQTLNNLGVTNKLMGKYDKALYYFEASLAIKRKLDDKELLASTLNNLGEMAALAGHNSKALRYYEESILLRQQISDNYGIIRTLLSLSDFLCEQGEYRHAIQKVQQAIIVLLPEFADTSLFAHPEAFKYPVDYNIIAVLDKKSNIFRKWYESDRQNIQMLQEAFNILVLITDIIEQIRLSYEDEKSKLYLMQHTRILYSEAITIAIDLFEITRDNNYKTHAFELSEKCKARILLDLINKSKATLHIDIPDSLLIQEIEIRQKISGLQKQRYETKSIAEKEAIDNEIFIHKQNLDLLINRLCYQYPQYAGIRNLEYEANLESVQRFLTPDDLFLQFHYVDSILFTFILTNQSNNVIKTELGSDFVMHIENISDMFTNPQRLISSRSDSTYIRSAYRLYEYLLDPVFQHFDKTKLIIIPDDILYHIPFEALLDSRPTDMHTGFSKLPYLIRKYALSYNYSSSMFINSAQTGYMDQKNDIAAFALSFKRNNNSTVADIDTFRNNYFDLTLPELPGVSEEVRRILDIIPGMAYYDSTATKQQFFGAGNDFKIIHIATHGIIDNDEPMFSRLILSKGVEADADSILYTWELFETGVQAQLAVLSACNTGLGQLHPGEGMMTLARGFLYAGVPSLVISLWNVNDASSVEIMEGFYKYLKLGLDKPMSLQKAKLDYLESGDDFLAHPYFWGAFIQLGNTNAIEFRNKKRIKPQDWIIAAVFVLITFYFLAKGRKLVKAK